MSRYERGRYGRERNSYRRFNSNTPSVSNADDSRSEEASGRERDRPRSRHPPGLRGRDIGMFYAKLNKERQLEERKEPLQKLRISNKLKAEMGQLSTLKMFDQSEVDRNTYGHMHDSMFKQAFLKTISESFENKLNGFATDNFTPQNSLLDLQLKAELYEKLNNPEYRRMLKFRKKLPVYQSKDAILDLLEKNQVIIISGETGCGKTTQVAQFIIDDFILKERGSLCKVVCTQPRRISAISVANRVAEEKCESVGGYSGFAVRLERVLPRRRGSVNFCTAGYLVEQMKDNNSINEISHLIIDEVHERDIQCDMLLTIMKEVISRQKNIKLILMSATINSELFSQYYNNCPQINIPGFTYDVKEIFLEDILHRVNFQFELRNIDPVWKNKRKRGSSKRNSESDEFQNLILPYVEQLIAEKKYPPAIIAQIANPSSEILNCDLIYEVIIYIHKNKPDGAILVFVPGIMDITNLSRLLERCPYLSSEDIVIPLHSRLPTVQQQSIFNRPPRGVRKIILATSIAETSITIDDVVYVIDTGKIKMKRYDHKNDIETLNSEWISLANANQRRGRAGRVQPGICYHLYSKARHQHLDAYQTPEILRIRLEEVILRLKLFQVAKVEPFLNKFLDAPKKQSIINSIHVLIRLNALDEEERLTPLGYHLAYLPMDPRSGKLILLGAMFSCLDPILSIAASLSFKNAFLSPIGRDKEVLEKKLILSKNSKSDLLLLAEVIKEWESYSQGRQRRFCYDNFLSNDILQLLAEMKQKFAQHLYDMNFIASPNLKDKKFNRNSHDQKLLKAIICGGLYPNVAKITVKSNPRRMIHKILTAEDGRVELFPSTVNVNAYFSSPSFLVYFLKIKSSSVFLHDSTQVYPMSLLFFADKVKCESLSNGDVSMRISSLISFSCKTRDALIINDLRSKLNSLLEYKVSHPGFFDWNSQSNEITLLRVIKHLITMDENDDD